MKHNNVLKQVNTLNLTIQSKLHTWTVNNVQYSETHYTASRGSIELTWSVRADGVTAFNVMVVDRNDPSDARSDYMGKVSHVYKVTKLADTFKLFEVTSGNNAFKLAGNLTNMIRI